MTPQAPASAPHRLAWQVATIAGVRPETATARTLVLDVPGWPGHLAGQHLIVRLTAEDGYSAQRSYSIASAPASTGSGIDGSSGANPGSADRGSADRGRADRGRLELTVQRLADGEVSPYLTDVMERGDQVEVRGPIGGWFVWDSRSSSPVQLIAGGSGIVPLMSMIRAARGTAAFRLLYSVRTPADIIYAEELAQRSRHPSLDVTYLLTRARPAPREASSGEGDGSVLYGRITGEAVAATTWAPQARPAIFVCGPSGFVEAASTLLIAAGHPPATIKTERFGPTS